MKPNRLFTSLAALTALCTAHTASAGLVFESDPANGVSNRPANDSIMTRFEVSSPVALTNIGVEMDLASAGNLNYVIFNSITGALLFQSGAEAFADDGMGFNVSAPFAFILNPGTRYALGAMADVASIQNFTVPGGKTMGDITSLGQNQNATGFLNPTFNSSLAGTDARVQLFSTAIVPEPGTALFGLALLGTTLVRRRRC